MSAKKNGTRPRAKEPKSDTAVSYDEFKEYEGQKYTGMKVGRSHKWYYDKGDWKETKVTPDLWRISYAVNKRRAGKAPEGSGVTVGTEYHWYVLAHQNVSKVTANDYTTSLSGLKFKIAHRRAGSEKWSATPRTQRKRMIEFLRSVIAELETQQEEAASTREASGPSKSKASAKTKTSAKRTTSRTRSRKKVAAKQLELAPATDVPSPELSTDGKSRPSTKRGREPAAPPSMKRPTRRRKARATK